MLRIYEKTIKIKKQDLKVFAKNCSFASIGYLVQKTIKDFAEPKKKIIGVLYFSVDMKKGELTLKYDI